MADEHGNYDSDVFLSVKVPSRQMQNQNAHVTTVSLTHLRLTATTTKSTTTLGKLFMPMCLCSPSSIIWYLVRVYMLKALLLAAVYGPNDQGGIVEAVIITGCTTADAVYYRPTVDCDPSVSITSNRS